MRVDLGDAPPLEMSTMRVDEDTLSTPIAVSDDHVRGLRLRLAVVVSEVIDDLEHHVSELAKELAHEGLRCQLPLLAGRERVRH